MPKIFEQLIRRLPTKKVLNFKDVFEIFLALIHDKYDFVEFSSLIEDNTIELSPKIRVNQVRSKQKTGQEL